MFQARNNKSLRKELLSELPKLEKAIESKQFVAHANSILDTEMATEKVTLDYFFDVYIFDPLHKLIYSLLET